MGQNGGHGPIPIYGKTAANKRPQTKTLLHIWLKARGISHEKFARQVGCNVKMVDYWATGRCIPTLIYAFVIEKVTRGGVSVATWLGTDMGKIQWNMAMQRAAQ